MRKLVFVLALLVPSVAGAQSLGCFVENGSSVCSDRKIICGTLESFQSNLAVFGPSVAGLCDNARQLLDIVNDCQNGYNEVVSNRDEWINYATEIETHWKACGATNDQIRGSIFYWQGLSQYYEGLANRLRAKCGKNCKKVQ